MATDTNGIATKQNCNSLCSVNGFTGTLTECVTKSDVDNSSNVYLKSGHGITDNTKLVKYSLLGSRWNTSYAKQPIYIKIVNNTGQSVALYYISPTVTITTVAKSTNYTGTTSDVTTTKTYACSTVNEYLANGSTKTITLTTTDFYLATGGNSTTAYQGSVEFYGGSIGATGATSATLQWPTYGTSTYTLNNTNSHTKKFSLSSMLAHLNALKSGGWTFTMTLKK